MARECAHVADVLSLAHALPKAPASAAGAGAGNGIGLIDLLGHTAGKTAAEAQQPDACKHDAVGRVRTVHGPHTQGPLGDSEGMPLVATSGEWQVASGLARGALQ